MKHSQILKQLKIVDHLLKTTDHNKIWNVRQHINQLISDLEGKEQDDINESCLGCSFYQKYLPFKCGFNCSFYTSEIDIMTKFCAFYTKINDNDKTKTN